MSILLHKPYLVKWSTKRGGGSKKSKFLSTWFMNDPLYFFLPSTHCFSLVQHSLQFSSISAQVLNFIHCFVAELKVENLQLGVMKHFKIHSSTEDTIIAEIPSLLIHFPWMEHSSEKIGWTKLKTNIIRMKCMLCKNPFLSTEGIMRKWKN